MRVANLIGVSCDAMRWICGTISSHGATPQYSVIC
jgi:hypothetical protein